VFDYKLIYIEASFFNGDLEDQINMKILKEFEREKSGF